jgi:protocatechuate 3,4-dioxygenase beta subunit
MQAIPSKASTYFLTVLLGIFLLAGNQQSFAQDVNASLSGEVTDPAGAVIPGAKVTLINETSGARQDFQTDASGEYNFRNLPPGIYDLSVTAPAFESYVRKAIELAVNQTARADVKLTVGTADQTVTVSADASLINYENPTSEEE